MLQRCIRSLWGVGRLGKVRKNAPGMLDTLRSLRESYSRWLEQAREYNYSDIVESYTAEIKDIDMQIHGVSRVAAMVKRGGAPMLCAHSDECD